MRYHTGMRFSHTFFLIAIFVVSLTLHFVGIWHPREAVFDEVHFGKFVSGYVTGEYFFDIHPPLGKLMIAGMGEIAGFKPGFDFGKIGEEYPNSQYIWLRFLPALFGSLLIPLIYLLTWRLSRSLWASQLAAIFVAFENAILVQSKFILMDSFLLVFGFLALYLFLESKLFFKEGRWGMWSCAAAAISAGLALSVKWTAASFLSLILFFGFFVLVKKIMPLFRRRSRMGEMQKKDLMHTIYAYGMFLVIPLILYVMFFAVHFSLLPKPGPGNAYMTARFVQSQKAGFPIGDFASNFYELNAEMFRANQRITATHAYSSKWYTWPFMLRPVYFWNKDIVAAGHASVYEKIYLLGNPFVWWLSTITVIYFFLVGVMKWLHALYLRLAGKRKAETGEKGVSPFTWLFLITAYCVNLFPFIFIGRVMFLYHYLTALVIAIIIAAISVASFPRPRRIFFHLLIAGTLAGFFVIFPITYGTLMPGSIPWPRSVFWLNSWI